MKVKDQGGFSQEVAELKLFSTYVKNRSGYFSHARTIKSDKAIEKALRCTGLMERGVLDWLGCTRARHSFTEPFRGLSNEQLDSLMKDVCEDAFIQVTLQNHPDHDGTRKSTITLRKVLKLTKLRFSSNVMDIK